MTITKPVYQDERWDISLNAALDVLDAGVTAQQASLTALSALVAARTYTRTTASKTTASLVNAARESGTVTLTGAAAYRVFRVAADRACRVRLYTTTAARDADVARAVGTDPTGDHGVVLDIVFPALVLSYDTSPVVDGWLPGTAGTVPITIDNLSGATSTVAVTLTYVRTE